MDRSVQRNKLYPLAGISRNPGIEVQRATLPHCHAMPADPQPTRLTLARWLVRARQILSTARVQVNRLWRNCSARPGVHVGGFREHKAQSQHIRNGSIGSRRNSYRRVGAEADDQADRDVIHLPAVLGRPGWNWLSATPIMISLLGRRGCACRRADPRRNSGHQRTACRDVGGPSVRRHSPARFPTRDIRTSGWRARAGTGTVAASTPGFSDHTVAQSLCSMRRTPAAPEVVANDRTPRFSPSPLLDDPGLFGSRAGPCAPPASRTSRVAWRTYRLCVCCVWAVRRGPRKDRLIPLLSSTEEFFESEASSAALIAKFPT